MRMSDVYRYQKIDEQEFLCDVVTINGVALDIKIYPLFIAVAIPLHRVKDMGLTYKATEDMWGDFNISNLKGLDDHGYAYNSVCNEFHELVPKTQKFNLGDLADVYMVEGSDQITLEFT